MPAIQLLDTSLFNDANLVSYYRLEGNSTDSKGSNNGSDTSVTYNTTNGRFGQGAGFNGSTSRIQIGNNLFRYTGDFSIVGWIKAASFPATNGGGIFSNYFFHGSSQPSGFIFSTGDANGGGSNANKLQFFLFQDTTSDTGNPLIGATALSVGNWYHVAVTRKGSTRSRIYVNGILDAVDTNTLNPVFSTNAYSAIGVQQYDAAAYVGFANAAYDDIAVFNRELTSDEVFKLFSGVSGSLAYFM